MDKHAPTAADQISCEEGGKYLVKHVAGALEEMANGGVPASIFLTSAFDTAEQAEVCARPTLPPPGLEI